MGAKIVSTDSKQVAGDERQAAPRRALLAARWRGVDVRGLEVVGGVMLPVVVGLADSRQAEIGPP